jgi:hypothetical protein
VLYGEKGTAVVAQKNVSAGPNQRKVVRISAPPKSGQSPNTRSIRNEVGLDDKIIMALDKLMGDFDLYDFLEEKGEQMESMQQYLEEADETTMPGKAKLLYRRSTETLGPALEESKKSANERFERSIKAMADADQGLRPEPEPEIEPEPEPEPEEEMTDDNEGNAKERNMDFAVEVTTDTTAHNEKSLEALLKKQPQPQEVSADGSTNEKGAEAINTVDLSPIKKEIKNKVDLAKKSAFKSLGLYLQGLAKGLIDDNVENLCCSDTTTLDEEGPTKSTTCIEKEMEERNQTEEILPSAPNVQQQQKDVGQAIVPTSEDVLEAGKRS